MIEVVLIAILMWVAIWCVYKYTLKRNCIYGELKANDQVAIMRRGNTEAEGIIVKVKWGFIQIETKDTICTIPNSILKDSIVLFKQKDER